MRTNLGITYLKTDNCKVLTLMDSSVYNADLPIENSYLEITVPGFTSYVQVPYTPSTMILLNTRNLKLSDLLEDVPSGIYKINQSIKPNSRLNKVTYVLHECTERKKLAEILCYRMSLDMSYDDLFELFMQLDIAGMVLANGELDKAQKLYDLVSRAIMIKHKEVDCGV